MNNEQDVSQEDKDYAIDRNLREAYEQLHFREGWAEQVLRNIASESERQKVSALNRVQSSYGLKLSALAATLILAALGTYWLAVTPHRTAPTDPRLAKRVQATAEKLPKLQEATMRPTLNGQQTETVTGESGYLAAQLSEDPEFEIHVVLPTQNATKF